MPIRNWGGGGDHSDTFIALQDEFIRLARAAEERAKAEREARAARRSSGGGSRSGGGGGGGSSQGVHDGAGVIIEGMSTGATNWRDLYAYYKNELRRAKKGTSLYNQIQRQIENIEYVASVNGINLSNGKVPQFLTQAQPGTNRYTEDSYLTPDVEAAINDQIMFLMATHNGIYPNTERPLASYAARMLYEGTVAELRAGMIADAKLQEEIMIDIRDGKTMILDPVSGSYINVTPEFTLNLIYQYNENQLALAGLERGMGATDGDFGTRMSTWENAQESIIAPLISQKVFPAVAEDGTALEPNVAGIRGYMDQQMLQFNVLKNIALFSSDPADVLRSISSSGRMLDRSMKELLKFVESMPEGFEVEEYIMNDINYSIQLADFMRRSATMSPEDIMAEGAALLEAHPGDGYFMSKTDVTHLIGGWSDEVGKEGEKGSALEGRISPGWSGLAGARAAQEGINVNNQARTLGEPAIGAERYVYVVPFGQTSPVAVPASEAAEYLSALSGNELLAEGLANGAVPSIEKVRINGRLEATVVWREMRAPAEDEIMWWTKTNNRGQQVWATMADYEQFGQDRILAARLGWQQAPFAGLENIYTVVGADGHTYFVRGDTKQIYVNQPINLPIGANFHPTDLLDEQGRVLDQYEHVKFNGLPTLYGPGVDYQTARRIAIQAVTAGEIDLNNYTWLNSEGVPLNVPTIEELAASYIPPKTYWSGTYHQDLRRNYDSSSRQYYESARREQARAKEVQRQFIAQQSKPAMRKEGFQEQYENVIANSLEVAKRQTGIHFGASGEKRARSFGEQIEVPQIDRMMDAIPPVTIDEVRPIIAGPQALAAVRMPAEKPPATVAKPAPKPTTNQPKSKPAATKPKAPATKPKKPPTQTPL